MAESTTKTGAAGATSAEPATGSALAHWGLLPVWVALFLSLAATGFVWRMTERHVEAHQLQEFEIRAQELRLRLHNRLDAYTQILRGAVGLFKASDQVTRKDWHDFVASLELEKSYPAIQAVAFARHVDAQELAQLTTALRAGGVADFAARPAGERDAYVVNVYAEPYVGLNQKALGFDMWQEPIRRRAMEDALQRRAPAITEKVTLKIDEPGNPVPAFIMYLPVTDVAGDPLYGFVLSPFRMPDLVADLHTPATRGIQIGRAHV